MSHVLARTRPVRCLVSFTALAALGALLLAAGLARAAVQSSLWIPASMPEDVERVGATVFLAGAGLDYIGPYTGSAAALSPVDGTRDPAFPEIFGISGGTVRCAVPDGAGGWYLGGEFSRAGGLDRANLVHVAADRTVSAWNPGTNGVVHSIALEGGVLYVGGNFTTLGGLTRNRAGAVNAATGSVTSWNPNVSAMVSAVHVAPSAVYLGGLFSAVGGQPRSYIAAVDRANGAPLAFNPGADGGVLSFEQAGNTLYAGGSFTTIGGQSRLRLAALDATTGAPTAWNPGAAGTVADLELEGGVLYAAGSFTGLGTGLRHRIGALDTLTGAVTAFQPSLLGANTVYSIAVEGGVVYAGGDFTGVGPSLPLTPRRNLAAFDATTGALLPWNPHPGSTVFCVRALPGEVLAGGYFTSLNGAPRAGLAALSAATGEALPFAPSFAQGIPRVLATNGATLFVGGNFNGGFQTPPYYLTSYDAVTFAPTGWQPVLNGEVTALLVDGSTLYVAGGFTQANGQARPGLAAFDIPGGTLLPFASGSVSGTVEALAVNGSELLLAGSVFSIGGQPRTRVAAVDKVTGALSSWAPSVSGTWARDLEVAGGRIWIGGDFTFVEGQSRLRLAAFDAATHALTAWNPGASGPVFSLAVQGNRVLAAGTFTSAGTPVAQRMGLVELDGTTGAATSWNPRADNALYDVEPAGGRIYLLGPATSYDGVGRAFFAALDDPQFVDVAPALPGRATLRLSAPAPNPTHGPIGLRFDLPRAGTVSLAVHDLAGRRVRSLVEREWLPAGPHHREADLTGLAHGVYFVRLDAGLESASASVAVGR